MSRGGQEVARRAGDHHAEEQLLLALAAGNAIIGPDGVFVALDEAFWAMLGYREDQLRAARWPSVIHRENAKAHRDIARRLRAAEIDDAQIETCYMHAQGLLVPVDGTISAVRDGEYPPGHLVFRVDAGRAGGR